MSVIVGYTISTSAFDLGRVLRHGEFTRIELDRLVTGDDTLVRYFWVHEAEPVAFQKLLERSDLVTQVDLVDEFEQAFLCRVHWNAEADADGLLNLISAQGGVVLEARGTPERWRGRVRFHSPADAGAFQRACHDHGIALTVTDIHELAVPASATWVGSVELSSKQREALSLALERGYFEIPRQVSLVELSDELGVSDATLSDRLRRAYGNLARAVVNSGRSESANG